MNCPPIETLSDLLDGASPTIARWRLRRHLARCADCSRRFAAERRLRDQVRLFAGTVAAPARMRASVLNALACQAPARRRRRTSAVVVMAACVAALTALVVVRPAAVRPLPAFAQVEQATAQVRTATWTQHFSIYDVPKNTTRRFAIRYAARLFNPPALRQDFGGTVILLDAKRLTVRREPGLTTYAMPQRPWESFIVFGPPEQPAGALRKHILEKLLAPAASAAHSPRGWRVSRERLAGRSLVRFDSGTKSGGHAATRANRLIRPGYRCVVWADPETQRAVRTLSEYYDGGKHTLVIASDFRYDVLLPSEPGDASPGH